MSHPLGRVLAFAPAGRQGVAFAAAATRAGAVGTLAFEHGHADSIPAAIEQLRRLVDGPFAVRVPRGEPLGNWLADAPSTLTAVVGTEAGTGDWPGFVAEVSRHGRLPLAEVTSTESGLLAVSAGAFGLIASGHEAGGLVSELSAFILTQALLGTTDVEIWARGGVGPDAAAGCVAMGAAGVVVDGAALMGRESPLDAQALERIGRLDGGETVLVGPTNGPRWRVLAPPGSPALLALREATPKGDLAWFSAVSRWVGWGPGQAWPVGQDAAMARGLASKFVTVGGIVAAVERGIDSGISVARSSRPLAENSPLAASHSTRFPIVQGPMTRVSDSVAFASAVADGGALPMLALAMLRGPEVRTLLHETRTRLAGKSWGVGLLGFVAPELRREQVAAVLDARPPFALIAGGRPDHAAELERAGIATYLHAPSPGLLRQYIKDSARRFVFEGRECGGHVGPRSSFVLWEQAIEVLSEAIDGGTPAAEFHTLFAGGVHDARSSAFLAAMTARIAGRGVKVGILMGTAYLFTREAVETGAIVGRYQDEAIRCRSTVLLETGPGHEVRVGPSPFADLFEQTRSELKAGGRSPDAIREELEGLNAGRLRVATKGLDRSTGANSPLRSVAEPEQFERGLYMLGQAALLRDGVTTIGDLHREVSDGGAALIDEIEAMKAPEIGAATPSDIAIVGISAIFPGAADARTFWENTLKGLDTISEIPPDRWDWRLYYDADPKAPDKIVSKWGGFVPDVAFDPLQYGMPPNSLASIEPVQLLTLEAVRAAIEDAGYTRRPFARERTSVVLGIGGGAAQLAMGYAFRAYLPMLDAVSPGAGADALKACEGLLPEWTEDAFPGFLLNVAAGRVANRFDFGGSNYAVDAACGSSLAAANLAVRELETGAADMVVLGGADTVQNPLTYLAFSKTQAFSPRGRCRPFDTSADGIVISEGVAAIVLKRLADAERDGDRIYAVIKGIGSSSDGRARGLTAPRPEGQTLALKRAYAKAGIDPKTVGYVEAHGTGTAVGDVVEAMALSGLLTEAGATPSSCAVGSVKSSIGHTKCAAGMAGLINAALALHHKVYPPTIGVEAPNPKVNFGTGPLHVSAQLRPWLHDERSRPRRAGVSAFGFGGTNFHAVLEGYDRNLAPPTAPSREWPAELFAWSAPDRGSLLEAIDRFGQTLEGPLRDHSHATLSAFKPSNSGPVLAIVAESLADLRSKLDSAIGSIRGGAADLSDPRGIHFAHAPAFRSTPLAFLFPGQGSQAPGMLGDLAIAFSPVRESFETFDAALVSAGRPAVGPLVFPPASFIEAERSARVAALRSPEVSQPAVGAASVGMMRLLAELGVTPDVVAGHSYGELVALHAAGCLPASALAEVSEARGRFLLDAIPDEPGMMVALPVGPERAREVINGWTDVLSVNFNGPTQTVIAGPRASVALAVASARKLGHVARELKVACAFHTPSMAAAEAPLTRLLAQRLDTSPRLPVYSNVDAAPHPADPSAIAARMGRHVTSPVRFTSMIERMHDDGARIFLECGPGAVLSPLVSSILGDRPHLVLSLDAAGRPGLPTLLHGLARLVVAGVPMNLTRLTADRVDQRASTSTDRKALPASTWLVNGSRARPIDQPEPRRLGQVMEPREPRIQPVAREPRTPTLPLPKPVAPIEAKAIAPRPEARPAPAPAPAADDRVMLAFQETMRKFLDVQRSTMGDYLAGRGRIATPQPQTKRASTTQRANPTPEASAPAAPVAKATSIEVRPPGQAQAPVVRDDREAIGEALVAIVRDRTGYPAEMLRPDLDLEADLGIDSIKRVEILGTLRDAFPAAAGRLDAQAMDDLARSKTLGAIADRFARALDVAPPKRTPEPASPVRRFVLEAVAAEIEGNASLAVGGVVIVTDDGRGIARTVASAIEARGYVAMVVGHGEGRGRCDFSSEASIEELLREARRRGPLAGIVHALPLRDAADAGLDEAAWTDRLGPELYSLFLLARAAATDLERSAKLGGSCLIAATGMGGLSGGVGSLPTHFPPSHGSVAGLTKTLAREWPAVRVRSVDLDRDEAIETLAGRLVEEVFAADPRSEVGHQGVRRMALAARPEPLEVRAGGLVLEPGAPVILTGGARGITAAIALELARRWKPRLLIVGTTAAPTGDEDPETADIDDPAKLKALLLGRAQRRGERASTTSLESAYRDLTRAREIRRNLAALRDAGALVEYGAADVRDSQALGRLLGGWRHQFGPAVGLVHGAGVIHDKLLRDKSPESFDRVFGTKVIGALNFLRSVDLDALRFASLFSSIAGRFGNQGQIDYAAANEALNKLALWLDREIPGRVLSAIWGPWSGVGMVSDLEGHLGRRGLTMIPPDVGARLFADELAHGRKGTVEVVFSGSLGTLELPPGPGHVAGGPR
ncbi:SDR family NAD(P)-dependent oxidoreductase [Isosphaeraceae bacterium EP7]